MPDGAAAPGELPLRELSASDCLDLGFQLGRGVRHGRLGAAFLALIGLTAGVMVLLWSAFRSDLIASGGQDVQPDTLQAATAAILVLALFRLVVGTLVARAAYEKARGPLDPPPAPRRAALAVLALAPFVLAFEHACILLFRPESLLAGTVSLLPLEALSGRLTGPEVTVSTLVWLIALPYLRLAPTIVAVEGAGPLRALLRAIRLGLAAQGRLHGIQVLLGLITTAIAAGIGFILVAVFGDPAFEQSDSDFLSLDPASATALTTALILARSGLTPATHLVDLAAYLELRVRVEGLDVERDGRRAGLLAGGAAR